MTSKNSDIHARLFPRLRGYLKLNSYEPIKIYLKNADYYRNIVIQYDMWEKLIKTLSNENLSREELLLNMLLLLSNPNLGIFTPLLGDIAGWQHYEITPDVLTGSVWWMSLCLKNNIHNRPKSRPIQRIEHMRILDIFLKLKQ